MSSWIVIAAHRREMYLVGGGGPLDIVLFRQWPFSPWSVGWSVQCQKLEDFRSFLSFASGPVPRCGQYSILSGSKAYTCSLIMTVRQGLFPPPFSAHSTGSGPPQRDRESTEHLSHWRELSPHPIPNSSSPRMIVLGSF